MSELRIGKVCNVDLATGMVSVEYEDRESVTDTIPFVNYGGEYNPPVIGSYVLVAHLSTGACGIVIGTYWNSSNTPPQTGNIYFKQLSKQSEDAYIKYDENTKELTIKAKTIKLQQEGD